MRKVVIPVAGLGTRFLPATAAQPKEMLPLVDRPVIEYGVEEARQAGLTDLLLITSRTKRAIEDHFDVPPEFVRAARDRGLPIATHEDLHLHFARQNQPLGLGHAVGLAMEHTGGEAFAVLLPDDVLVGPPCCLGEMAQIYEATGRPVVAVRRVPRSAISAYGVVAPAPGSTGPGVYEVSDLIEKPSPDSAPSDLAIVGRYVLPPEIFPLLRAQRAAVGGEVQLTDALRRLNRIRPLLAYEFPGRVYDTGSKLGYLQATVDLAMAHPNLGPAFSAFVAMRADELPATAD